MIKIIRKYVRTERALYAFSTVAAMLMLVVLILALYFAPVFTQVLFIIIAVGVVAIMIKETVENYL